MKKKKVDSSLLILVIGLTLIFILAVSSFMLRQSQTTSTEASSAHSASQFVSTYRGRVPDEPPLVPLSVRQKHMTPEQRSQSDERVYFVANYPSTSGGYAEWHDTERGVTVAARSWKGIYEIFPEHDYKELLNSSLSKNEVELALNERKQAIKQFMSGIYGHILNETVTGKYRVEITDFAYEVQRARYYSSQFREKYGIDVDLLEQSPKIAAIQVLADARYHQIDVIIDQNMFGTTVNRPMSHEEHQHYALYQGLTNEGLDAMAEVIQRIDRIVHASSTFSQIRYIYMNEIDLLNCHAFNCGNSSVHYLEGSAVTPDEYADSYYRLGQRLADLDIQLVPSAFNYGYIWTSPVMVNSEGVNPWVDAMARARKNASEPVLEYDYLGTNLHGDLQTQQGKMKQIEEQIAKVNSQHGTDLVLVRIQEIGMLPQQPSPHQYQRNMGTRIAELKKMMAYFERFDAGIYAQTALNLSPWDGNVPDSLLYGDTRYRIGFIYRDEPEIWPMMRDTLLRMYAPSVNLDQLRADVEEYLADNPQGQRSLPQQPAEQSQESLTQDEVPSREDSPSESNQQLQEPQSELKQQEVQQQASDVNCPGIAAGVTNTCGGLDWRGCYCDTVNGKQVYVNSCGKAGAEEFSVTNVGCGQTDEQEAPQPEPQQKSEASIVCYTNEYCNSIGAGKCAGGSCSRATKGVCEGARGLGGVSATAADESVPSVGCSADRFGSASGGGSEGGGSASDNSGTSDSGSSGESCPDGKECPNPVQTCSQESCGGDVGNCASCPDGYKWCYGGYCVR